MRIAYAMRMAELFKRAHVMRPAHRKRSRIGRDHISVKWENKKVPANLNVSVSLEDRYDLIANKNVTLNGTAAVVCGAKCEYAIVATLDGRYRAEYTWRTIKHVVENLNGKFKT